MAGIVFSGIADDADVQGTLFQGIKFWISQKVPQRSRFLGDVKANGGEILPLEKSADIKIVDHARKEAPPGSHSYTFIEKSIRNGVLEDLDDHKVGPPEGNIRSIGSVVQPAKETRNKYTEADDRLLWHWVNDNPQKGGGTDGNEIYKQLEKKHPQHPWQSWRNRWIKNFKGRAAPFALPHNAPPTPPLDVPPAIESADHRETTSDTAEDDYHSFSDVDAEALMVNGDDILNIHSDNITEAWESWTRDHDKDSIHTAQQWHKYWEEEVRPRYLKRKAKQTRRPSPENTIPVRSQLPISPRGTVPAPPSTLSPFKADYPLLPELPKQTISKLQTSTSPKRFMVTLPTAASPAPKPDYSLTHESPEKSLLPGARKPFLPKSPVVVSPSHSSLSVEIDYSLEPAARSPSYHPESPTLTGTAPSSDQQATNVLSKPIPSLPSNDEPQISRTPEKTRSPNHETLKRKVVAIEEFPSSSPLGPISPKRRRPSASELPLEIASTPEKVRGGGIQAPSSPLFINLELEEDEPSLPDDSTENESPLGRQLSDTLSEPGLFLNNTQAVFGDATQLIDFDIPPPLGGWDDEELLFKSRSQLASLNFPPPEDGGENNQDDNKAHIQRIGFDLQTPEGGRNDEEPEVKEESESPDAETYDPQPSLPDTQAILRSKTPAPDFSIPDPDGGWSNLITSSPPLMPDSPGAQSAFSQTELKEQMDAWINAHAVRGISVEQVESVLKSTSMDTDLADKALRHLARKGVLPKDRRGVWTASDDEDLKSTDARKIERLQEKHGAECLAARWEFLDFYAEES